MAEITNVSKLIINYLTEEQYQTAKASGLINENELYIESAQTLLGVAHSAVARFVVGTSASGWTAADCDYLCDGTADQTEINQAIQDLPASGGEIVILDGTYNITAKIDVTKDNVSIRGNGNATILKRMFNSSVKEGVITLTSRSGCKIANLQIDGNKTSYTNSNNSGIGLDESSNNTVTGNTCNNNNGNGIEITFSSNNNTVTGNTCNNNDNGIGLSYSGNRNTVTGNTCIRGTGLPTDYTESQHTIRLKGTDNNYNLISNNNCMGKAVTNEGGTGNTLINNKFDSGDYKDFTQDEKTKLAGMNPPIAVTATLSTTWTGSGPYTQSVTVSGVTSTNSITVSLASTATAAQREAARSAMLSATAQATNSITVTADGDKPTVALPIQVLILGG